MSESSRLLSEVESAELAGVSLDTLRQYHQFGLLDAIERDQSRYFKESDIRTLFYTRLPRAQREPAAPTPAPDEPEISMSAVERFVTRAVNAARKDMELPAADEAQRQEEKGNDTATTEPSARSDEKPPTLDAILAEAVETQASAPVPPATSPVEEAPAQPLQEPAKEPPAPQVDPEAAAAKPTPVDVPPQQAAVSPAQLDARELNALLREQIEILREERDWLRQRVERLEARSEREQMLLLSESETIRNLVSMNEGERKKRFWTFALPWFQK